LTERLEFLGQSLVAFGLVVDALDDAQGGAAVTVAALAGRVGVAWAAEHDADPELELGIGFVLDELVEARGVSSRRW
jgi:hypothetical protein